LRCARHDPTLTLSSHLIAITTDYEVYTLLALDDATLAGACAQML
jgi:hypothetical protein